MSKFYGSTTFNTPKAILTKNNEGAVAFKMEDKEKLMTQVLTSFFNEEKFYGDNSSDLIETAKRIMNSDARFVANLILFTRNEMHMRSVTHALSAELAKHINGKPFARRTIERVTERVDDMTEIMSYQMQKFGRTIPNSMKKGISTSFAGFSEYELQKYDKNKSYSCGKCGKKVKLEEGKAKCEECGKYVEDVKIKNPVSLKDIICLTHVKHSELVKKVLTGNLEVAKTWETEVSAKGNNKKVWEDLINENRLGYMAAMRNLRNILQAFVSAPVMDKLLALLTSPERVARNKQLPFRYWTAYRELQKSGIGTSKVLSALEEAIKLSTANMDKLPGLTFISTDTSGSMMSARISSKSDVTCADIGVLLTAMANYICEDSILTTFDTKLKSCTLPTTGGIIQNANSIRIDGGGTDITLPIRYLLDTGRKVDRIIILSDNEINSGYDGTCQTLVNKYRREVNPNVWVHAIDLQGYGTQQFKGEKVNLISGWSEKVLQFIPLVENGENGLIDKISNYYFKGE